MIVDHKWFCIRCNKVWNLAIDNFNPDDRQKLDNAFSQMTMHVLTNQNDFASHEIIHKEKIRGFNPKIV